MERTIKGGWTTTGKSEAGSRMEEGIITNHRKVIIDVCGIGHGSGQTLIAMSLARRLAEMGKSVCYISDSSSVYDIISMDRKFNRRQFADLFERAGLGLPVNNRANLYRGVNWVVPRENDIFNDNQLSITEPAGEYVVLDTGRISDRIDRNAWSDCIVCVVDPLPSKMISGIDEYREIRETQDGTFTKVFYLMNKFNDGVNLREAERFLKIRFDCIERLFSPEEIYRTEYEGVPFFSEAELEGVEKLCEMILKEWN